MGMRFFSGKEEDEIEIKPAELKASLDKVSGFETKLGDLDKSIDAKMKPVMDYIAEQRQKDEDARKAAEANETRRKQQEQQQGIEVNPTDWLADPETATKKTLAPVVQLALQTQAKQLLDDVLGEKEYYHGELRSKVKALLMNQPLQMQTNPTVIENAYKTVVFDHMKDIQEGKIKTRAQAAVFSSTGTGGHSGSESEKKELELTPEEKHAAKIFGISESDYAKSKNEVSYV